MPPLLSGRFTRSTRPCQSLRDGDLQEHAVLTGFPARQTLSQVPGHGCLFGCRPRAGVWEGRHMAGGPSGKLRLHPPTSPSAWLLGALNPPDFKLRASVRVWGRKQKHTGLRQNSRVGRWALQGRPLQGLRPGNEATIPTATECVHG